MPNANLSLKCLTGYSIYFHCCRLHQLFLEERIENAYSDPARLVKLKKRQFDGSAVEAKSGKSYMEKILEMPSPDHKMVCETSITSLPVKFMSDNTSETGISILEINGSSPRRKSMGNGNSHSSSNKQDLEPNSCSEMDGKTDGFLVEEPEQISSGGTDKMSSKHLKVPAETELVDNDEQKKIECSLDEYHSDDAASEVDDYMDALATMDSELEIDNDCRPKKSFLNVQKVTDSNGEEHQLQAQFSDSESFGDSSLSEEIGSFEQNTLEEHNEAQARLLDSRSAGTPCASDDNSSFSRNRKEELTQLQAQISDSHVGNSSSDIENMSPNQLPQTVESLNTCDEFVTHDDARDQGRAISDSGPFSSGLCPVDSGSLLLSSDHGATAASLMSLPTRTQSDETPHVPVERHLRFEDDEDRGYFVDSIAAGSFALSLIKDHGCPVVYFDNNSLNNLDLRDSHVDSNTLLQVSDDLNLAHEGECGEHSDIKVLQAESLNELSSEISVVGDIGSPGEDPICLPMDVDLNSGTKLLLDSWDLKSDNDTKAIQLDSEDLCPVVETTVENSFTEELCSDFTHRNPQDELDSAEVEILYPDHRSNFDEVPRIMSGDEINGSFCCLDPVEDDDHIKHPPSPDYMLQDNDVMANDVFPVKVQSKDLAASAIPSLDNAETGASIANCLASDSISYPSMSSSNSPESLPGSSDSHRMEIESSDAELTKISTDLNAENRENQLEPFSDITSPVSRLAKFEESLSTFEDCHEKKMEFEEEDARNSLIEFTAHIVEDQLETASTNEQLNLNRSVPSNPSDYAICNNFQHSLVKEKIQDGSSLDDIKMVTPCSELDSQKSEPIFVCQNDLQNSKDIFSPHSGNQPEPETHLELLLKPQVAQQDVEFLLRKEEKCTPARFEPQLMQIPNQLEQERKSCAASEFSAEIHPEEPTHGSSSKSSDQKINLTKHVKDPLEPILPDLYPKATKIKFEETPPMPPLPPMQWIMNKVQTASLVSHREEIGVSQVSFQPIQPVKPDYKSQFGLSTSERVTLPYQNPFLHVVAVESNTSLHSSGGVSEHPDAIPLQVMVNEANGLHNYLVLERSQIHNPFLTLPMLSYGGLPHGRAIASEGENILNSSPCPPMLSSECADSGAGPIYQQEKLTQSTSQLMEDTSLEAKKDSSGESVLNASPCRPILPVECAVLEADPIFQQDEQTQSSSQLMEDTSFEAKKDSPGELHLVLPAAECPVSGDDPISPKEQHSHSPNQLIEETLQFITLEESSINLEMEQGDHLVSSESPPSIKIVQPNHIPLPSEGDLAPSLDTSAKSFEFDSQMSNGKPNNKLPHPQNQLIDVVAALDKSRVKTVFLFSSNVLFMWSYFLHNALPLYHCS